jgi:hypothetical protein
LSVVARAPGVSIDRATAFWFAKLQCGDSSDPSLPLSDDPLAVEYLRHMGRGEPIAPFNGLPPSK